MPVGGNHLLRFGPYQLDTQCGQLRKNGFGLKLQGQPVQILEILLEKPGELVTREELRQRLWSSDTFVDFDHSLNTAIKRLRQVLGDEVETPSYIETIPKRGYRFIGEAVHDEKQNGEGTPVVDDVVEKVATTQGAAATSAEKKSKSRVNRMGAALVLGLFAAVMIYWVSLPPPMPRVVRSYALTKTGFRKWRVVTDATAVYFPEIRPPHTVTMRVPTAGGDPVPIPSPLDGSLHDISPDGSQALFIVNAGAGFDAWVQPLPSGTPRLIIKDARFPAWTADGRSILFARQSDHELWQASVDGTGARRLAEVPDISGIAVSPDGDHIRLTDQSTGTLWEMASDGSNAKALAREPGHGRWSFAQGKWSPDGKYFFFSGWGLHGNLWVRSEERQWWKRKLPLRQLTFGPLHIDAPAISKDGKHLYAVGREAHGELAVYDKRAGAFVPYLGGIPACYVDFSRDGQWITYVSYPEGTLWRSRIDGSERRQLTLPPLIVENPRWSPDGRLITFHAVTETEVAPRIYLVSAEGGGPMLLPTNGENPADPTWSPDGKSIAYAVGNGFSGKSSEVRILDLGTQKSSKVPGSDGLWSARYSPDGKYLVALDAYPSKLWLLSFATQKWTQLASGNIFWPTWSRDSKAVYFQQADSNSLVRVGIVDHKIEPLASTVGLSLTAVHAPNSWFGTTPDGRFITTLDTGMDEVYAFDLEYK